MSMWATLRRKWRRIPSVFKELGLFGLLRYTWRTYLFPGPRASSSHLLSSHRNDVLAFYRFIDAPAEPPTPFTDAVVPHSINWLIPDFHIGSGGHTTIFRMIQHLERQGFDNRIVVVGPTQYPSGEQARKIIRTHFFPLDAAVSLGEDTIRPAQFTVATGWQTAYFARRFQRTRHKVYFIQDMEPAFFPVGSEHAFAEATYRFGFDGAITAGDWLAAMAKRYGMAAYPFGFAYDKGIHYPRPRRDQQQRIFFYARHVTPRRGFELGLLALERVWRKYPDIHVILAGWDCGEFQLPFIHLNAGVVDPPTLADLSSQCDVALVLSLTNGSLLPLELMACGCPVVSNDGPCIEWLLRHEQNALLAKATPEDLAAALLRVLEDPVLATRLRDNGLRHAAATDWAVEGDKVAQAFRAIAAKTGERTL